MTIDGGAEVAELGEDVLEKGLFFGEEFVGIVVVERVEEGAGDGNAGSNKDLAV